MRVLVLHGPNLNLLGEREPQIYGTQTLADINEAIGKAARELGFEVQCEQHASEGAIIEALHRAGATWGGAIVNPGAYAHYSYAIADAIAAIRIPVIEVHLSNVAAREEFRRISVTAAACRGVITGLGASGYVLALRALAELLSN
ncbi:MAG: type II 3-dehydroquinate dehydratase [Candidatus Eremiobacteraeota bacterium]|nr:type II 3-dehydroquinate dehydratase [Candidatus Eremiobacteraeota bacterium]MBV9056600.1 type II 3-dehydroquinate dehydratase [Candidatus Eremiobacteraeota bacterium]